MKKYSLANYSFKIGVIAFSLKIILVGAFIFFFSKQISNTQIMINLTHAVSVLALIGLLLSVAAAINKQWGWRLFVGFFLNLIAVVIYPLVYTV